VIDNLKKIIRLNIVKIDKTYFNFKNIIKLFENEKIYQNFNSEYLKSLYLFTLIGLHY
jgi:hypothetical protein